MPNQLLDDLYISGLICPKERAHLEVFDSELRGFYVDVLESGKKSFRLRYRYEKKLRVVTLGDAKFISADEARAQAINLITKAKKGIDPTLALESGFGPRVGAFLLEKYLPYVKSYKRSWQTDESMIRNHLQKDFGKKHIGSIGPADVAIFLQNMKASGYAPGTCNRALVLLRYSYELAIRWGEPGVERNPVKQIKNLRDDNKIERFLSEAQAHRLLEEVQKSESAMLAPIIMFLLYTGARKREVLDAKWQDIDFARKALRIPRTKSGKVRHVPLSLGAMALLFKLRDAHEKVTCPHTGFIFANPKTGLAYNSFYYSWHAARCRAGLPDFRVHDLRHSFASFLVNSGRSLYEVQELLGHADIRTTSRYAHLAREKLVEAVECVPVLSLKRSE
jgi:integrase